MNSVSQVSTQNARRDRVSMLLKQLKVRIKENPEKDHTDLDETLTKELRSIRKDEIQGVPEHSNLEPFPVWQTIATAGMYASIAGLWAIRPQRRIQNYLPNNDPAWLSIFRDEWSRVRLKEDCTAVDLLHLLLVRRAKFRTMAKTNPSDN